MAKTDLKALQALRARLGTAAVAERLGIPAPSLRRILSTGKPGRQASKIQSVIKRAPKRAPSKSERQRIAQYKKRSSAAKRGWANRRAAEAERKESIELARAWALRGDAGAHGRRRDDWMFLKQLIQDNDRRWCQFLAEASNLADLSELKDFWFSPEMV